MVIPSLVRIQFISLSFNEFFQALAWVCGFWELLIHLIIYYYSILNLILLFLTLLVLFFIFWYFNFNFAVNIVNSILYFITPIFYAIKFLVNFFIVQPCVYLYNMTAADWKITITWLFTVSILMLFLYFFFVNSLFTILLTFISTLNQLLVIILLVIILLFIILLFYFWYKQYFFMLNFIRLLFFIIKPFYLLITNLLFFFIVRPLVFVYNLTLEDWKIIGVYSIMISFMIIFLYVAYLFICLCLQDLRWLEVVFMPVGYGKPPKS